MESWRLIDLDYSELLVAQTFYEAVAEAVLGENLRTPLYCCNQAALMLTCARDSVDVQAAGGTG
jgi:hypothetical protein